MKKNILMSLMLAAALLSGCGSQTAASGKNEAAETEYEASGTAAMDYEPDEYAYSEEAKNESVPQEETDPAVYQEKLVYRGSLSIESLTYDDTLKNIRELVGKYGGITENESESDDNYGWYSDHYQPKRNLWMTVRIPTEQYQQFLQDMEGTGKVISRSSDVENITRRYNDTSVQIEALQQQEERLLDMMSKAETIEDMILVETRLTEVQTQLNQLRTDLNVMDTDVRYSTVTISLREVHEYTEYNPTFGERLANAFSKGWDNFTGLIGDLIILAVMLWPLILIVAAVIFAVLTVRGRKKKAAAAEKTGKEIL